MPKSENIISFLRFFLSKRGRPIKTKELLKKFDISDSTLRRYIRMLRSLGYHVNTTAEGYELNIDCLNPVVFTKAEAGSIIVAQKLIENYSDTSIIQHFEKVVEKVITVLRKPDYGFVETLTTLTGNQKKEPYQKERFPHNFLSDIQSAIVSGSVIWIEYYIFYKDSHSQREIVPIRLYFENPTWHVLAYCLKKNDYRDFRLDRIIDLKITDKKFETCEKYSLAAYTKRTDETQKKTKVVMSIDNSIHRLLHHEKYGLGFQSEKETDNRIEMTFSTEKITELTHWLLLWGNKVEIIKPVSIKNEMRKLVKELAKHYLA